MKNNLILATVFIFVNIIVNNVLFAAEFKLESSQINILDDGNTIMAYDGTAISKEKDIIVDATRLEYNKKQSLLIAKQGVAKFPKRNLMISANKLYYNEITSILEATGKVKIIDSKRNIIIISENIFFDSQKEKIYSNVATVINYNLNNEIKVKSFIFETNKDLIKLNDATIIDADKNIYLLEKAFINLNSNKLIAKDVSIDFNNLYFNKGNQPRIKANSMLINDNNIVLKKGVFTACKKNDDCPPWQITSDEISHDKKKKTIYYKDAFLKLYDVPIFYFPRFFHPDPTVKRKSGFLIPKFQDSTNIGASLSVPYFLAIADDKDATFTPIFYSKDKYIIQSEYRDIKKTSKNNIDSSIFHSSGSNKSHFFYKGLKKLKFKNFDESNLALKLQQTSHDTYLKTYKLKSPLIENESSLNSSLSLNLYREDLSFTGDIQVYEDLSKTESDRYEYVFPNFDLLKKIENNTKLNGNFSLSSNGYLKNYNTNINEKILVNDLIFNSDSFINTSGIKNEYNFIIKNVNTDSKNSDKYKKKMDSTVASIFEYNSSYPTIKKTEKYNNIFEPKASIRVGSNQTLDISNNDIRSDIDNIFSLNRGGTNETLEAGTSLTYGAGFTKINNLKDGREILNFRLANILRFEENKELSRNSQIGEKTSDIFGRFKYSPAEIIDIDYNFSLKNNLKDTNYQLLKTEFKVNNFITNFEYLNENNTLNKESYLTNTTTYNVNEFKNISFKTRKNKKTKLTEFYNLIYQYKNDCLAAAIEYQKDYYNDRDLKAEESIFFKLTIIPLGGAASPSMKP